MAGDENENSVQQVAIESGPDGESGPGIGGGDQGGAPIPASLEEKRAAEEVDRDDRIKQLEAQIRRRDQRMRLNLGIILLAFAFVAVAGYLYRGILFTEENLVISLMIGFGLLYFSGTIFNSGETDTSRLQSDLDSLLRQRRVAERLKNFYQPSGPEGDEKAAKGPTYFDQLVQTNVENLGEYYELVRRHTENSFRVTLMAAVVGFFLIAAGLMAGFNSNGENDVVAYISAGSGVFVEFISGVFFYLYSRTVQQLKRYHDSLLEVQNILLSFRLIEDSTAEERTAMIGKMLSFLMNRKAASLDEPIEINTSTKKE